jgi:putative tricarboxylic transport membrane protein
VAFVHTVTQRATDQSLIVAASSSTTLNLAQGLWGSLTERDVRWLGAVGAEYGAFAVRSDARWQHLGELVEEWRRNPAAIVVSGGSAVASQDHMKVLLLANAAGINAAKIRFVPFDGGGEAMSALLGGFVQLFSGDASEMIPQLDAGNVRVLTVFAPERLGGRFADVPTARESGFDVEWINWRGLYVPADVSQEAYTVWLDRITVLGQSEAWQRAREQSRLEPFLLVGTEFEQFVHDQVVTFRDMAREIGIVQ